MSLPGPAPRPATREDLAAACEAIAAALDDVDQALARARRTLAAQRCRFGLDDTRA